MNGQSSEEHELDNSDLVGSEPVQTDTAVVYRLCLCRVVLGLSRSSGMEGRGVALVLC